MNKAKRVCLFCGKSNAMSNEHVLPQWLLEAMGIRKDNFKMVHSYLNVEISKRQHNLENLVNGNVCVICNNGWMSKLESEVKNILLDMVYVRNIGFINKLKTDDVIRDKLAKWCYKTAIVLNNASNYRNLVPVAHFRNFFSKKSIPYNVTVLMGLCEKQDVTWIQSQPSFILTADVEGCKDSIASSYKINMEIGNFLFKVIYFPKKHYVEPQKTAIELYPNFCLHEKTPEHIFYKDILSFDFETINVI
ncbi:hypothetical protein ACFC4S_31015 [Priestia megaterium]|uniref:hypothetical protein n=1 Tax=Priestia megaterium TaxID=1404 RepID=UPI0035D73A89